MREIRRLSEDDLEAAQAVRWAAFTRPPDVESANARMLPLLEYTLGAFERGRLVSVVTMRDTGAYLGGSVQPFAGMAGVATAPQARRRGHVRALILRWFEEMNEQGVGFIGEFPFDIAYYPLFGFQSVPYGRRLEVPIKRFAQHLAALGESRRRPDAEEVDHFDKRVAERYDAYAARYDFPMHRRRGPPRDTWASALLPPWSPEHRYTYLVPGGYLSVQIGPGDTMTVWDHAWLDPGARADVLAFVAAMEGNYEKVRIFLPPDDPLVVEWQGHYSASQNAYQLRIANLGAALAPFRAPVEQHLRLRLRDDSCPWNDGVFDLTLSPAGNHVERVAGSSDSGRVDAALDQRALVSLLCNAVSPAGLLLAGLAEGSLESLEALARLRGRPVFFPAADGY